MLGHVLIFITFKLTKATLIIHFQNFVSESSSGISNIFNQFDFFIPALLVIFLVNSEIKKRKNGLKIIFSGYYLLTPALYLISFVFRQSFQVHMSL